MSNIIKGYKVFKPDWTCRSFQYEVGKTYYHEGLITLCRTGFHFCRRAVDCFNYYDFDPRNKVAEVEALGRIKASDDGKSATDCIRIVREIPWQELLTIINTGAACTGQCNSANFNSGNFNSGNCNSGDFNSGDYNNGNRNSGNCNSGNYNDGNRNSGCFNSGYGNSGHYNSGYLNSGCFNSGNHHSGFFNTDDAFVHAFNKPTKLNFSEFVALRGFQVLQKHYKNNQWIPSESMSEEEVRNRPSCRTTGGYLKTIPFKDACRLMWEELSADDRAAVRALPNFDADIFEEITGIDAR